MSRSERGEPNPLRGVEQIVVPRQYRGVHDHHQHVSPEILGRPNTATTVPTELGSGMTTGSTPPEVQVGPFWVSTSPKAELVDQVVELALPGRERPGFVYALHVAGLNSRHERDFVVAMRQADIVYADGGSVVWLARLAGGHSVERTPTTDIGWDILSGFAEKVGRAPRVALIGGPPDLSQRAGAALQNAGVAEVVYAEHGFHDDWSRPLAELREIDPDVTLVGLGAPREMVWAEQHRDELPTGLVLTCGGWFGHIVGDERRAPRLLRRSGLEWIARVAQAPTRLGPRYARGVGATAVLAISTLQRRPLSGVE
jgi:N-acetylglucosaminyldiphosphoundecaprenol N-acetyl-beta-D-mannosaminyltransferase